MHIGKKLGIFVVCFCLTAVVIVSSALSLWFEHRVKELRYNAFNVELVNIDEQLRRDIEQLELFTQIYAAPVASLPPEQRYLLEGAWTQSQLGQYLSLYIVEQGKLVPLSDTHSDLNFFQLDPIPRALLELSSPKSGLYLTNDAYFIVSVVPVADIGAVMMVRKLESQQLMNYGLAGLVTDITLQPGPAADDITAKQHNYSADLAVPLLLPSNVLHLQVNFTERAFEQVELKYDLVTYLIIAFGLLLLVLGYMWLRVSIIRPFKHLMLQLDQIDPNATHYSQLRGQGCAELVVMATSVNRLLEKIFLQKERAKTTLESIAEAVILTNTQAKVVYLNRQAEQLLATSNNTACGMPLAQLISDDKDVEQAVFNVMSQQPSKPMVKKIKVRANGPKVMERSISHLRDHQQAIIGTVVVLRDITQEELLTRQLRRRVSYDPVTLLLNRCAFEEKLEGFSVGAQTVALCYFDLEQFKLINDSCGHNAGDRILKMVAKAIQSSVDDDALVARLGGDEFGLALRDHSALAIAQLAKQIIHAIILQVLEHQGCHYRIGVSTGVALARAPFINAKELLKDADIACIAAKQKGCNQIHFYDDKDKELNYQRNAPKWAVRIAQAIEHNELLLYYQPIKSMARLPSRQRMEILLRIQEPCGRILSPAQFIAAAERFKLMTDVDKEVIRKTFLWLSLNEHLWADHCLSINLSGNSLGAEGMVEYIAEQLNRFDIPSSCICFEITETSAIQNRNRAMDMLNRLRKLGFSFALDDFGSGFASYGYLRELPVDYVKIDGCFVKTIASNAKDYAIVKSIHDVCCVMGIETVAEFVENQEIIDKLSDIGINYAQGYAIGRPQSLDLYQKDIAPNAKAIA
ncbi:EAL domain-containing protein [Shewanella sp. Scap07]|uniref:bifunctional diguanylate cyclase/phosphodiesterase n=1 Tax=Shewanella sp. Scap07 TaxID=2589987 RepID=UPI0015BD75CA|nr:EAL domain-containing protein [Shewanella sp. Scap07]QLE87190.1 EAL domain-containing protein [Shewanella sp. Scap07]